VSGHLFRQEHYLEQAFGQIRTYKVEFPKPEATISALHPLEKRISLLSSNEVLIHLNELSPQEKEAGKIYFWYCKEPLLKKIPAKTLPKEIPNDWNGTPVGLDPRYGFMTFKA